VVVPDDELYFIVKVFEPAVTVKILAMLNRNGATFELCNDVVLLAALVVAPEIAKSTFPVPSIHVEIITKTFVPVVKVTDAPTVVKSV
jgi:hypothetical protein